MQDKVEQYGGITVLVEHRNGTCETIRFPNVILNNGRNAIASFLVGEAEGVFIRSMLFGDGGYDKSKEIKKIVNHSRNGLFGLTRAVKPVIGQIDPLIPTEATFTSVITYEEANGYTLNEMALQLSNDNLFSMATFADLGKTEQIQLTFNWRITVV